MTSLPLRSPRAALAAAAVLAALGLASCSSAGGGAASQSASASPTAPGASASQTPGSAAPSSSAAASTDAGQSQSSAAPKPSSSPVPSPTVQAKGDAAKDAPAGWPESYRVPTKHEDKGLDTVLAAQKKATQIPESVAREAAKPSASAKPTPPDFGPSVEGAALSELQADYVEAAQNGWVTTGTPVLKGEPRVVDLDTDRVRVFACIDYSSVQMKDAGGKVMQAATAAGTRARLQIYDMTKKDGAYVVTSHQVAAEHPEC
ncbi:hypothetical protein [Galactobacter valiniphilus]|uniref:hypothetical protein n=1 Tax=Galactobacter valiniphilus TaxID=2676122 RepID=UPI0037368DAC